MRSTSPVKIGVIGAGYMGQNHSRILSSLENSSLTSICDIDKKKTEIISKQYKLNSYSNIDDLLDKEDLDAISICLPTSLHFEVARKALKKQVAVFLEKPICATVNEAKTLVKQSKSLKIPIMVGHIERFNPVINEIKKRIQFGELGKIIQVHTQRFSPPPGRADDVSAVVDLATHDIDIIRYLLGEKPIRVYAETENKFHKKDDIMSALMRFRSGTIGIVEVSWLHPIKIRTLNVLGENGMYSANYLTQELFFYRQNDKLFNRNSFSPVGNPLADVIKIAFESKEPLLNELQAFINSVQSHTAMPVTATDGLIAIELAQKIADSGFKHKILK